MDRLTPPHPRLLEPALHAPEPSRQSFHRTVGTKAYDHVGTFECPLVMAVGAFDGEIELEAYQIAGGADMLGAHLVSG